MKAISILGATGSIGVNTLNFIRDSKGRFRVASLACGKNIVLLAKQMEEFRPRLVAVIDKARADALKGMVGKRFRGDILFGETGYREAATIDAAEMVVSAMVGAAGLKPTIAAIKAEKDIALANKETLVMAGEIVMKLAKKRGVQILPVDSEHSAIFQCLDGKDKKEVSRIILTASGGPFFRRAIEEMDNISPMEALKHPNWSMGKKISIDSATMMNKGLEIIEARWLFDVAPERLDVLIHPQSIVHSLVEFHDGSSLAQMSLPDMRLPIAYALNHPRRTKLAYPRLSLADIKLEFFSPDGQRFPCLSLARQALRAGGLMPAALNAANEVAVEMFLSGDLIFAQIATLVAKAMRTIDNKENPSLEDILMADTSTREQAASLAANMTGKKLRARREYAMTKGIR